jgi:hypothetical protein
MTQNYRRAYLVEAKRLRILVACRFNHDQADAVERLLKNRGAW